MEAKGTEIELDGINETTATVRVVANTEVGVYAIEGYWDVHEQEGTQYFTLSSISSEILRFSGMNYADEVSGKVMWTDDNFEGLCEMESGVSFLIATYTVAANTPVGTYTVRFRSDVYMDNTDYIPDETVTYYTATIEVKAAAPSCEHKGETTFVDNKDGKTHSERCVDCSEIVDSTGKHAYDEATHKCVCGAESHTHEKYVPVDGGHQSV